MVPIVLEHKDSCVCQPVARIHVVHYRLLRSCDKIGAVFCRIRISQIVIASRFHGKERRREHAAFLNRIGPGFKRHLRCRLRPVQSGLHRREFPGRMCLMQGFQIWKIRCRKTVFGDIGRSVHILVVFIIICTGILFPCVSCIPFVSGICIFCTEVQECPFYIAAFSVNHNPVPEIAVCAFRPPGPQSGCDLTAVCRLSGPGERCSRSFSGVQSAVCLNKSCF